MFFIRNFIFLLLAGVSVISFADEGLPIQLYSERHRTEWNWVEYRISLTNRSGTPILNPEIRYFAENSFIQYCENHVNDVNCSATRYGDYARDSVLTVAVDNVDGPLAVTSSVFPDWKYTVMKFKGTGLLYPDRTVRINFRVYRKDWTRWDPSRDWSYQKDAGVVEPNYFMAVYDASSTLLWGNDPTNGKRNSDVVLWSDRGGNSVIGAFDGNAAATVPAGRFWMLKDIPLSAKERRLLAGIGIHKLDAGRHQGKSLLLFKADSAVRKGELDSLVGGFYNAFATDDTTRLKVDFLPEDQIKEETVCDSLGNCQRVVSVRTEFDMETGCWPDVSMQACKDIVVECGGKNASIDRNIVLSTHEKNSISCLEGSGDIRHLEVQRQGEPAMDISRKAANVDVLQNSEAWKEALGKTQPTLDWLSGADYTGEGITVGVYDTGIDWDHPGFNEDSVGTKIPRKVRESEMFGGTLVEQNATAWHATAVAGILGGNGAGTTEYKYRGIAPKVHFYSGTWGITNQLGHVVNHSHTDMKLNGDYLDFSYQTDRDLFYDWKDDCDMCDTLSKTYVVAAANNGGVNWQYPYQRGFHSILANSKNSITVGNISSATGLRYSTSSMGPTWDGRIKPDVMAPGATSQFIVNEENPFELYIDFIKIYRKNAGSPYFVMDFGANSFEIDSINLLANKSSIVSSVFDSDNGRAFSLLDDKAFQMSTYVGWKLGKVLNIEPTDTFEIRLKKISGLFSDKTLFGNIYFGIHETSFYNPVRSDDPSWFTNVSTIWNVDDDYVMTKIPLSALSRPLNAYFLRIDFSYSKGIVVPAPCKNGSCGYSMLDGGGTSMSAPVVSGIAALMYQRYQRVTGVLLNKKSMRNSTTKAILIHTSKDMEDTSAAHFEYNPDMMAALHDGKTLFTPYGKGPDFATGWGSVDAKAALDVINDYDKVGKKFRRFREFEIKNGMEKRWSFRVPADTGKLRVTLVWDDAPGNQESATADTYLDSKLVNDLDVYLISPSGKFFFPWRLQPLPTDNIDAAGNLTDDAIRRSGLENIKEGDIRDAERYCGKNDEVRDECFDHLNNVEVVDVDSPEKGTWQVAVRGTRVEIGNNADGDAQVASLVSDFSLGGNDCQIAHPYALQDSLVCEYGLGDNLESFVTFDPRTFAGSGDYIYLYDAADRLLGTYTGSELAGRRIRVKSKKLKVVLDSDNDGTQGWGFGVKRIERTPVSILPMLFEAAKKTKKEE